MHCFSSVRKRFGDVWVATIDIKIRLELSCGMRCFAIQKQLVSNLVGGDIAVLLRQLCVVVFKLSDQFPCLITVFGHVQVFNCGLP